MALGSPEAQLRSPSPGSRANTFLAAEATLAPQHRQRSDGCSAVAVFMAVVSRIMDRLASPNPDAQEGSLNAYKLLTLSVL
jgi:hypothetical protein